MSSQNTPSMAVWMQAWHNADAKKFKQVYSNDALIFPPNKSPVQGNDNILEFMKNGLGKVDVLFQVEKLIVNENLAFEFGTFKDRDISSKKITGKGIYTVTWVLEKHIWKIQCHTWSIPIKQ